jgi:hypothetical protein
MFQELQIFAFIIIIILIICGHFVDL